MSGKALLIGAAVIVLALGVVGAAFATGMDFSNVGVLQTFIFPVHIEIPAIAAGVDIKPETLQKQSAGQAVTVFIELPQGYDVADIDVATIRLCFGEVPCEDGGVAPDGAPGAKHGVSGLKVTFDRTEVIALVADVPPPATVTFTVSGKGSSWIFAGSDTVELID